MVGHRFTKTFRSVFCHPLTLNLQFMLIDIQTAFLQHLTIQTFVGGKNSLDGHLPYAVNEFK